MNYATLLALLAALSFTLPLLVQLGEKAGVSRNSGIAVTLLFVIFLAAWLLLRRPLKKQAENGASLSDSQQTELQAESRGQKAEGKKPKS
jgi:Tfp pilus assembly protein PilN